MTSHRSTTGDLLSPGRTLTLFTQVDALLATLLENVARIPLAGQVNEEQASRVLFAMRVTAGVRQLFQDEIGRQMQRLEPSIKES